MINWKVRLKNPVFWVQISVAIIVPVLAYFGLNWSDITSWQVLGSLFVQVIKNPVVVVSVFVSVFNAVNDPTTKGLYDSINALTYEVPKDDNIQS